MKIAGHTLAVLPFVGTTLAAAAAKGSQICLTQLGLSSVKSVPTYTTTATGAAPTTTVFVRTTSTKYLGAWFTFTDHTLATVTTTATPVTDTVTSTSTAFTTSTQVTTSSITITSTNTQTSYTTPTTTIATTAGFQNIQDTVNSYVLSNKRRNVPVHAPRAVTKLGLAASEYPSVVQCTTTVPNTRTVSSTSTLHVTKSVPYYQFSTTITLTTQTTTTSYPPDVTSIATATSTSTVNTLSTQLAYSTTTTTTTFTSFIPGPTQFSVCNPENQFGPTFTNQGQDYFVNNVLNNGPNVGAIFAIVADGANSFSECCYSCMTAGTCENFLYRAQNQNCFIMYHQGETCSSQANHPNIMLSELGSDDGSGYMVGNGNCGFGYSGDSDGSVFQVDSGSGNVN